MSKMGVICTAALLLLSSFNLPSGMEKNLPSTDKRYDSFYLALELIDEREAKVVVETGTARYGNREWCGDGASTLIFGEYAAHNGLDFWSVDINRRAIRSARHACRQYGCRVNFHTGDSVDFLKNFNKKIDFLYLDSYDYDANNPAPSQNHHLREIEAAYPHLHEDSVVMVDDCDLPGGGKGKLVQQFLEEKGWEVLYSGYQIIMIQ